MNIPELYKKFNVDKDYTSIGLFRELKKKFIIEKVFYPGCYVHITPSLIFENVTYADSFKNTYKFYENEETATFIEKNREYAEEPQFRFFQQDYHTPFNELTEEFDLIVSQYSGFVGQAVKTYLKVGGILACNNSHADASMASLDDNYELIAVYNRVSDEKFSISDKSLDTYLIPKKGIEPTRESLTKTMKGISYTKTPSGYIFRKVK